MRFQKPERVRRQYVLSHPKMRVRKKRMRRAMRQILWGRIRGPKKPPLLQTKGWCNGKRIWAWVLGTGSAKYQPFSRRPRT